jgi:uncharacterized protein YecE (DUF72 family)
MSLYVGTSGWAYKEWQPDFYPPDIKQGGFLSFYGRSLTACEINATFYRLQSEETCTKWADQTPEEFRFATKAHRRLTHSKSFAPHPEDRSFFDSFLKSVSSLGPRLGVVLFQFPPYRYRDDAQLATLLDALPAGPGYAFEFRHESWEEPVVAAAVAAAGGTLCVSNTDGSVPGRLPPGPVGYVRLRAERYTEEARAGWLRLLQAEAETRNVYAFAKHEGIPVRDPYGGIGLARWLAEHSG